MGLSFSGFGEISGMLESMVLTDSEKKDIMLRAAAPIYEDAQRNAKGSIARAMQTHYSGGKVTIGVHRRDWSEEEYYPAYVEYGHGGPHPAPPHPFVRPAFDAQKENAERIIINELKAKM